MHLLEQLKQASQLSGRSRYDIALEALRLRVSGIRLGLSEYIDFQLYQNDLTWEQKKMFGGVRIQRVIEDIVIDDYSRFLALDKVTMYTLFDGWGFPIPRVRATYRSLRPSSIPQLHTPAELEAYLEQPGNTPVYMKRSFGAYGRGNTLVTGVERGMVMTGGGKSEAMADFVASIDDGRSLGWMLQEPLASHASITELTGSKKISGIRLHTFLSKGSALPTKAIFKVNVGVRDTDNFEHGASGNMLAGVDIATGRVFRTVMGIGVKQVVNAGHPVTGKEIVGFEIPYWKETVALVTEAQKAFPGFLCPGWDIAICDDGPKILEVNACGDIDLSQHACRSSFFDETFMALMKERQLAALLTVVNSGGSKKSSLNHRTGIRKHHWQW
ncbi:MAG: sugar-transfer associated ATP-grasp domain-containing protein [Pseudomonadota bacterium]